MLTNACGSSTLVSDRVNKSWGYNVGRGPLWELLEDRGWYKEAFDSPRVTELDMRPRVYQTIPLGYQEVLDHQYAIPSSSQTNEFPLSHSSRKAAKYLPHAISTKPEDPPKPLPPTACSFGPFGKQTRLELRTFGTVKMCTCVAHRTQLCTHASSSSTVLFTKQVARIQCWRSRVGFGLVPHTS